MEAGPGLREGGAQTLPRQHEEDKVKRKSEVYEFRLPPKRTSDQDFGASRLLGCSLEAQ